MSTPPSGNSCRSLRNDALVIWRAAVAAVDSQRLVEQAVNSTGDRLAICGHIFTLAEVDRLCVVGGGKAGAGMAAGFESALAGSPWADRVSGWVNVPDDCVRPLRSIHLHPARPVARNEPTEAGAAGSDRILDLVSVLGPRDVCVVLLSGGGSALLPAPVPEISLADKQAVTRLLSRAGASIHELNCVRKQFSRIKGGGLARACRAGTLVTLIISDVIGDPLETIASGPTVPNTETPADALAVLRKYSGADEQVPPPVIAFLERQSTSTGVQSNDRRSTLATFDSRLSTLHSHVVGNNRVALDAAARKAAELGYSIDGLVTDQAGIARDVGVALAEKCLALRDGPAAPPVPVCVLSGGEPVVHVVKTDRPQTGGRNQELVLAAIEHLWTDGMDRICLVSGGTDGEDGPTDAAGAVADATLITNAKALDLNPAEFLPWNNAYPFFEQAGGLLKTGPTHTNVMDVRVALVDSP
jgi:hydroxypyruvate reductase